MKKIKLVLVAVMLLNLVILVSCTITPPQSGPFKVTFESNGGTKIESVIVERRETIDLPIPEKEGLHFHGWFKDSIFTEKFTNKNEVIEDITLYAKWSEYILISNFSDLENIKNDLTEKYILESDIDCLNVPFRTIADSLDTPFTGELNGDGYSLINFNIANNSGGMFFSLIGYNKGTIKNLNIKNSSITLESKYEHAIIYTGTFVGLNEGIVEKCQALDISISSTNTNSGSKYGDSEAALRTSLIVGTNAGTIKNCVAVGSVISYNKSLSKVYYIRAAGIAGENQGFIENCFVNVNATSTGYYKYTQGMLVKSGNTGEAGGIAAVNEKDATIEYCLVVGSFNGSYRDGDVCYRNSGLVAYCYRGNEVDTSNLYTVSTGLADESTLKDKYFYRDSLHWDEEIWDYSNVNIDEGKYPSIK